MKQILAFLSFGLVCGTAGAQSGWQKDMEEARRAAARGELTGVVVRPGSRAEGSWPVGVHIFFNHPRPFCYAYSVPGEWYPGRRGWLRSRDGRSLVGVTFRPPAELEAAAGASTIERARDVALKQLEREFRQPMTGVELKPFASARPNTWLLSANPIPVRDGRPIPFPFYVLVDLGPHAVAEVNTFNTPDNEGLARQVVESLKTTSEPECYTAELERLYKALHGERP